MNEDAIHYTDNPEIGELEEVAYDFLPPPEELVLSEPKKEKISIYLDEDILAFFRAHATALNTSYQQMIRNLLRGYVTEQTKIDTPSPK